LTLLWREAWAGKGAAFAANLLHLSCPQPK
jgi:hypothetical protein